jgi:hypothetical protein
MRCKEKYHLIDLCTKPPSFVKRGWGRFVERLIHLCYMISINGEALKNGFTACEPFFNCHAKFFMEICFAA